MINADSLEVEVSGIGTIEGEVSAVNSIEGEVNNTTTTADITLQEKIVIPSTSQQNIVFDNGYDGLSKVTVNAVNSSIDPDIKASNIKTGVNILGVTGTLKEYVEPKLQEKSVSPSTSSQSVTPDSSYDGLSKVTINAVTNSIDSNIQASNIKNGVSILGVTGTLEQGTTEDLSAELTAQSTLLTNQVVTIDDIKLALQNKTAGSGEEIILQEKTITPSTSQQNVIADTGYNGLSKVVVNAVTSAIDSDIKASNIKKGVNILGVTGTLEEGITPTGTINITTNGTHNVTNYASANINVPSEDLTSEFNDYETGLTEQETTIEDIMTALQGKTAGGGSSDIVSGSFVPTANYTSSDQYFECDLGFKPSAVYVYRKVWTSGVQSINGAFKSDYFGFGICNTASSNKAVEKLSTSSYITITDTGFKALGNSTYYLVGGSEYVYVAFKEVGVV